MFRKIFQGFRVVLFLKNPEDFATKIDEVLLLEHRSNGRDRIFELKLDSVSVANKLKEIYKDSSERSSHY